MNSNSNIKHNNEPGWAILYDNTPRSRVVALDLLKVVLYQNTIDVGIIATFRSRGTEKPLFLHLYGSKWEKPTNYGRKLSNVKCLLKRAVNDNTFDRL